MRGHVSVGELGTPGDRARWSWLLPAGTFVAGCVLGGTFVGVGAVGDDDPGGPASSAATAADRDASGSRDDQAGENAANASDAGTGLYVRVPDSCVQTAHDATMLVEHVDRVVAAIADLEPERLRQTVDQVQRVAEQCRQEAALRLQDAAGAEATPTS